MHPQQNFMYGGVPGPYTSGRFQGQPYGYVPRGRMPPQGQMYRTNGAGGRPPLVNNNGNGSLQQQQQQQQQAAMGSRGAGGVLPSLQGTHMLPGNRGLVQTSSSSGAVAPMPMPPTSPSGNFMRRPPGPMRPQPMPYPGGYPRGAMGMGGGVGGGHPTQPNNVMINERQNSGGLPGNRAEMQMKANGGRPMGSSLPILPGMADPHAKYPVPPHMMHHNYVSGGMPYGGPNYGYPVSSGSGDGSHGSVPMAAAAGGGGGGGHGGNSPASANSNDRNHHNTGYGAEVVNSASNDFNDGVLFTIKMDDDEVERAMQGDDVVVSGAVLEEAQNGCDVNTPPLATSDDDTGLTPTPPTLRYLSRYEEQEVKEYMPNVYFGGTDQCKKINAVRGADNNDGFDDENFHYRVVIGDHLLYRYEVLKVLGQGTFGIVVRAMDHKNHAQVAIKIIKNKPNYTKQAQEEIKTLELLNSDDPDDEANIVQLLESCVFRRHYLLVFELLPSDLYALIQANKFRPMARDFIYELSEQLLTALVHVRKHHIVHCDLKPENIMISESDPASSVSSEPVDFSLKLIDFGSACEESRPLFTYIQSRYYRAPEIVLGIPYTTAIDMWSFGCVLCELANGYPIFPASSEGELLERIVEYFGPIPSYLVHKGRRSDRFFDDDKMKSGLSKKRSAHPPNSRSLHNFLKVGHSEEDRLFEDFVSGCLHLDAKERLTPEAALEHPWMDQWRSFSAGSGISDVSSNSLMDD